MIAVYNLLNGKYDIDYSDFFTFSTTIYPHQRPYVQEFMPGDIFFYEKSGWAMEQFTPGSSSNMCQIWRGL